MEKITEREAYERYNNFLDETNTVRITTLTYSASSTLYEMDPIAYDCGFADFLDSEKLEILRNSKL